MSKYNGVFQGYMNAALHRSRMETDGEAFLNLPIVLLLNENNLLLYWLFRNHLWEQHLCPLKKNRVIVEDCIIRKDEELVSGGRSEESRV